MEETANSVVACCAPLVNTTRNLGQKSATRSATPGRGQTSNSPMTGRELRAQLRVQQKRKTPATPIASPEMKSCASAECTTQAYEPTEANPETEHRNARALALLADNLNWQRAVILEAGPPSILGVAIRGVAYGEIELAPDYDATLLLMLLGQYGETTQ